jgi:hypothetical protein
MSSALILAIVCATSALFAAFRNRDRRGGRRESPDTRRAGAVPDLPQADAVPGAVPARAETGGKEAAMNAEQSTFEQVRAFLDAREVSYNARDDERIIHTGFELPAGRFAVYIQVQGEPTCVFIGVELPIVIPEPQRPQAAEAVVRANCGLRIGRFDLDMSNGHLSFRVSMPVADNGISQAQFDYLMQGVLFFANRYYRAFGRLIFGDDLSPAEVIAEVEMAG